MGYRSIVCGVTGSSRSQKAALEAALLARRDNARLTYVYAADVSFLKQTGVSTKFSAQVVEEDLEKLGGHILDIAEEIARGQGVEPKMVVKAGEILNVLKEIVREEEADLLVLGHEERTFFEKALFKGDVEDHIRELKEQTGVDVLVIDH